MEAFITLIHGAGGRESHDLIESLIVKKVPPLLRHALEGHGLDVLDRRLFYQGWRELHCFLERLLHR